MRTKTKVLSALLGVLGTASLMAQSTNVYSLNAVGYINVTCPPGFSQIACPLIGSPDNTVNTLLNNASQVYTGDNVYFYFPATGQYVEDNALAIGGKQGTANTNGWALNGTNVLNPGVACWFQNNNKTNITITFVGTVPQGSLTNTLAVGFNLVSSAVPTSGDLMSNSITMLTNFNIGDAVYTFNPSNQLYTLFQSGAGKGFNGAGSYNSDWSVPLGDPVVTNVGQGFWYQNTGTKPVVWVENFSVNP
jgi:hypothetical protein